MNLASASTQLGLFRKLSSRFEPLFEAIVPVLDAPMLLQPAEQGDVSEPRRRHQESRQPDIGVMRHEYVGRLIMELAQRRRQGQDSYGHDVH